MVEEPMTPDLMDWRKTGDVDGPFPGAYFDNPETGDENYVSTLPTGDHVNNAVAASRLFNEMGVPAPDAMKVKTPSGRDALAQKLVPGADPDIESRMAEDDGFRTRLQGQFAPYAFMGLHDYEDGGIVSDADGIPVPTNLRATMKYDTFGAPKGAGFGPEPAEILSLRDPNLSPKSAALFGDMTEDDVRSSIQGSVARLGPDRIKEIMSETGMESALGDTLNTRRQRMLSDYEVDDPFVMPEPDVESMTEENIPGTGPMAQEPEQALGLEEGGLEDEGFGPEEALEPEESAGLEAEEALNQEEIPSGPLGGGPPTLDKFRKEFKATTSQDPGQRIRERKKRAEDTIVNIKQSLATVRPGDTHSITRLIATIKNFRNLYKDEPAVSAMFDDLLAQAYQQDMDTRAW